MTPLGRFSELDFSTTKRVPKITNVTSSASSRRRNVSKVDLTWHRHYSNSYFFFFFRFFRFFFFKSSLIKSFTLKLKS